MREKLRELTRRSPRALGLSRSRWTLKMLRTRLGEKAPETDSGTWRMLNRLGITHTRGRERTVSPDDQFEAKKAFIEGIRVRTSDSAGDKGPPTERIFYLDELTYELSPSIASDWSPARRQPTTRRSTDRLERGRLLAAMDTQTGRLFYRQKPSVGRKKLIDLYQEMVQTYSGERLWVVQDNTSFHFHPEVLRPLQTQVWPRAHPAFEYPLPSKWPDPTDAALSGGDLPVQVVPLPTYASWLNPIERLWRWLKQEVLHLHPYAGNWEKLKQGVQKFLERFTEESKELLSYTGVSGA